MGSLVQANYEELEQVAGGFANLANSAGEAYNKARQAVQNMQGKWIGEAATKFFQEMEGEVLPALNRLHEALERTATETKNIAQKMHEKEEEASSLFKGD